jgi:hypothetical protein
VAGFEDHVRDWRTRNPSFCHKLAIFAPPTMETSVAITGKGYVIIAADTIAAHSVVKMKRDEDKIKALGQHLLMGYSGEPGM